MFSHLIQDQQTKFSLAHRANASASSRSCYFTFCTAIVHHLKMSYQNLNNIDRNSYLSILTRSLNSFGGLHSIFNISESKFIKEIDFECRAIFFLIFLSKLLLKSLSPYLLSKIIG